MSSKRNRLYIISAPSGTGKSTVIGRLLELRKELVLSVSVTTRPPREGETDGLSYHFVTRERFQEMIGRGEFLEYTQYAGELYGTPKNPIFDYISRGKDILLEIEVQGARQVMAKEPGAVSIFIVPPDMRELERRLRGRGTDSGEKLAYRLDRARQELREKAFYDHIVVNNEVDCAAREILSIIDNTE